VESATCTTDKGLKFTIKELQDAMNRLPPPRNIIATDYKVLSNPYLPANTLIISMDLAEEIEKQMENDNAR
jgi:hypothetical protein